MLTSPGVIKQIFIQEAIKKVQQFMLGIHAHTFEKLKNADLHSDMSIRFTKTESGEFIAIAESLVRGNLLSRRFVFTEEDILQMASMQDAIINEENRKALLKKSASAPVLYSKSAKPLKEAKQELSVEQSKANVRHLLTDASLTQGPFKSLFTAVPSLNQNSSLEIIQTVGVFKVNIANFHGSRLQNAAPSVCINLSTQQFMNLAKAYAMGIHKGMLESRQFGERTSTYLSFKNATDAEFAGRALIGEFGMSSFCRVNNNTLEIGEALRNFIQETNQPTVRTLAIPALR